MNPNKSSFGSTLRTEILMICKNYIFYFSCCTLEANSSQVHVHLTFLKSKRAISVQVKESIVVKFLPIGADLRRKKASGFTIKILRVIHEKSAYLLPYVQDTSC